MDQVNIRRAIPEDADAIAEVHIRSRLDALPYLPHLHTDDETREWMATVVIPSQTVWVAESDDQIVGFAAISEGWLEHLYILPGFQGRGIGSRLFDITTEENPTGFTFWAFQRNANARAFYEHRGCVAVEFTDGAGNEENEPDVRYEWRPRDSG